jgi:hypothetical protein
MAKIDVAGTIKETDELLTQKDEILQQIADNRFLLRAAVRAKQATAEQANWIKETFPEQKTRTPEERVKAAEERLAEVRAKANSKGTRSRVAA